MGRPTERAKVRRWRGEWYIFYTDHATGRKVRVSCRSLGAHTPQSRREVEKHYRELERQAQLESIRRGWLVSKDARLLDDVMAYLVHCRERAGMRRVNPEARVGLSPKTLLRIRDTVEHFARWLDYSGRKDLLSKDLAGETLDVYFRYLVEEDAFHGKKVVKRSRSTINTYKQHLKTCLRWIQRLRPRRFLDLEELTASCKQARINGGQPVAFPPSTLASFLSKALEREQPSRRVEIVSRPGTRQRKPYRQRVSTSSSTPVSRLFILLALTGCRLGEALSMKWDAIDLDRGRISISAGKTGMLRWLPLTMAPEGEVAPRLLELLRAWREERPAAEFVLPHGNLPAPLFPKLAWSEVVKSVGCTRLMPQHLRQNFTSYAASLGIPAAVAAMWQGHSVEVAERHYRAQVLERGKDARSMEAAMGLEAPIRRLIELSG